MSNLTYDSKKFYLDGEPFRIISGAIHYFRVPAQYWEDRLKKLKACGFNTVETYTAWNLHEKQEGEFNFSGMLDIKKFLETANALGLKAIVRPGPFICAEFEYGGFPYWLNNYNLRLRCSDPIYVSKVRAYTNRLCEELRPMLYSNGGNIIAMQIENEYGSFGNDKDYLREIAKIYEENKMDCLYFTSDGPTEYMLTSGTLPEYLSTCNFGSRGAKAYEMFRRFRKDDPFMCMEFWNGWFDHWGEEHHTRTAQDAVDAMNEILDQNDDNGNINFYMFHGGTNFGFTAGANHYGKHQPTVTSYDYDSPLSECGDMTEKYYMVKEALAKRLGKAEEIEVHNLAKKAYGEVELTKKASLFSNLENLSTKVKSPFTMSMEELKLPVGFVMYSTVLRGEFDNQPLRVDEMNDRALIYINGKLSGIIDKALEIEDEIMLSFKEGDNVKLDILVENMARTNFGHEIGEKKGIASGVRIGDVHHSGFTMYPMELNDLSKLEYGEEVKGQPVFLQGEFIADKCVDTFIRLDGFKKGVVYIGDINLGRYWNDVGPQKTLYIPAPFMKQGTNKITVFELEGYEKATVTLTDKMDLG